MPFDRGGAAVLSGQIRALLLEERALLVADNPDLQQLKEKFDQIEKGFRALLDRADQYPAVGGRVDWSLLESLRELTAMRCENAGVLRERILRISRQFTQLKKEKTAILKYMAHEKEHF